MANGNKVDVTLWVSGSFDTTSVGRFAKKLCIAPGIVVGRLQHDKAIPFSSGNNLKTHFRFTHAEAACKA